MPSQTERTRPASRSTQLTWVVALLATMTAWLATHASAEAATGVTDWLNVADFGGDIQAALDATDDIHKVVYVPGGNYYRTTPLVFPMNREVRLVGDGPNRTYLRWMSGSTTSYYITITGSAQEIQDLTITGPGSDVGGLDYDAILVAPTGVLQAMVIRHVRFEGIRGWGIRMIGDGPNQCNDNLIEQCSFFDFIKGIYVGGVATSIQFRGIDVHGGAGTCFQFEDAHLVTVEASVLGNPSSGGPVITAHNSTGITLIGCDLAVLDNPSPFLSITGNNNAHYSITNCRFRRQADYARLVRCDAPGDDVRSLVITNPAVYLDHPQPDPNRNDDIVLNAPSSAVILGGHLESSTGVAAPLRIGGSATAVFTANYNERVRIPQLGPGGRDALLDMKAGDLVFNVDRLNHWDGSRWREEVAFFPSTAAANAPPAGISMPPISTTTRDAIPPVLRPEGSMLYNASTHRVQHFDGSRFLEGVASVPASQRDYVQRTTQIPSEVLVTAPADGGFYRYILVALTHTTMNTNQVVKLSWTDPSGISRLNSYTLSAAVGNNSLQQDVKTIYLPPNGTLSLQSTGSISSGSFDVHVRVEDLH